MGARSDQATDPEIVSALLQARRGTAFYQRALAALTDSELAAPALTAEWSRRHVIAHVGYQARALTRLVQAANLGERGAMYAGPGQREAEIELGATLPAHALRHLDQHAAISLDVEWRDTPQPVWENLVDADRGGDVPLTETLWLRAREVWLQALNLRSNARAATIPRGVLDRVARENEAGALDPELAGIAAAAG